MLQLSILQINARIVFFLTAFFFLLAGNAQDKVQNNKPEQRYGRPVFIVTTRASILTKKEVQSIKNSKIIVAQFGCKEDDEAFFEAVKMFWTFNSDIDTMPYHRAIQLASTDKKILVLSHASTSSEQYRMGEVDQDYKSIEPGRWLVLEDGSKRVRMLENVPALGKDEVLTLEAISAGLSIMNTILIVRDKYQMKNFGLRKKVVEHAEDKLQNRTLLIPRELLSDKISEATISEIYPGKFKLVSYDEYRKAILSKKKGMAYVFIAPVNSGSGIVYSQYILDAEEGLVLGYCSPAAVTLVTPDLFDNVRVDKGNRCEINESSLKSYRKAYERE